MMLLYSPFPHLPTLNPPTTRCRLRLLSLSPSTAAVSAAAATPVVRNSIDFMVDYLVDSLEFSRPEAISKLSKVTPFESSTEPELVLNCLQKHGFNKTQIRKIVSSAPKILSCKVDQTLEPKIKFLLQDIGFSISDIVVFIKNPPIIYKDLDSFIIPVINYLKEVMGGSDEKVVQTVRNYPLILASSLKKMQLNVELLRSYGIADEKIRKFIIKNPRRILFHNPKRMEEVLIRVDKEWGIHIDSPMFLHGVHALISVSKETLDLKLKMFKSFGWTDSDIAIMCRQQPQCLNMSEDKIRRVLNFLMKELGYTSEYLATRYSFMNYSLDKRLKPRYQVLKALRENKLINVKPGLCSAAQMPEPKFLKRYVLRYMDKLPNLYEIYTNSMKE